MQSLRCGKKANLDAARAVLRSRLGKVIKLKHPHYTAIFHGVFFSDKEGKRCFEESYTGIRVTVPRAKETSRDPITSEHCQLYMSMRGEHANRQKRAARAAKGARAALHLPATAGDMVVKGTTPAGKLLYTWQLNAEGEARACSSFEVVVAPRKLRGDLGDGHSESTYKLKPQREPTPERALRKMHEKVKRSAAKAKRGEPERIVATAPASAQADPGAPPQDPFSQLDDPAVLQHLRGAYEFLQTCHLHYCENCDEEWPVFDLDAWPQGGVAFAGSRAGQCETIAKTGWFAAWNSDQKCHRCENQGSAYAKMYSQANRQHLGPRRPGLSALTWYESLLVARVHPVISVVTLTATGLLCYAGHVCNYYVKVLEWFRELPALLRDKNGSW